MFEAAAEQEPELVELSAFGPMFHVVSDTYLRSSTMFAAFPETKGSLGRSEISRVYEAPMENHRMKQQHSKTITLVVRLPTGISLFQRCHSGLNLYIYGIGMENSELLFLSNTLSLNVQSCIFIQL